MFIWYFRITCDYCFSTWFSWPLNTCHTAFDSCKETKDFKIKLIFFSISFLIHDTKLFKSMFLLNETLSSCGFFIYYVIYSWSEIPKQLPLFLSLWWIKQSKNANATQTMLSAIFSESSWVKGCCVRKSVIITCLQSMDAEDVLSQHSDYSKYKNSWQIEMRFATGLPSIRRCELHPVSEQYCRQFAWKLGIFKAF